MNYISILTIFLGFMNGINAQVESYRAILEQDGSLYFAESIDFQSLSISKKVLEDKDDQPRDLVLTPNSCNKTGLVQEAYSNFAIVNDQIFSISYCNYNPLPSSNFPEKIRSKIEYNKYYFEIRDRHSSCMEGAIGYFPHNKKLKLENEKELIYYPNPVFNYDFIVQDSIIYLLVLLENQFYIYRNINVTDESGGFWKLKSTLSSPFRQEYFLLTSSINDDYSIHTKSQGRYTLKNFNDTNPSIVKSDESVLGSQVFLDDMRTNTTYELDKREFKSLISSKNHVQKLNKIIKTKNKR